MALRIDHDVDMGTRQLLEAPRDIPERAEQDGATKSYDAAREEHRQLYRDYRDAMPEMYKIAESWWIGCVAAFEAQGLPDDRALDAAFEKRFAGPASSPFFVAFVRAYWLDCARINDGLPLEDRVPPQDVLLRWLVDDGLRDFQTLVTCMPYWPIGLDENGNWC